MTRVTKQTLRCFWGGAAAAMVLGAAPLQAAVLSVHVANSGQPLPDAVVTAVAHAQVAEPRSNRAHPNAVMLQQNQQFEPFVLPIQVGTTVQFPNHDPFRHHVYSFSPAKSFELKLYGGDRTETVTFDKTGIVALGCNIHDNMLAYIDVVDTPYFAKTDSNGNAVIADLPAGTYTITLWHPDQGTQKAPSQNVTLSADAKTKLDLASDFKRERRQRPARPVDESAY